MKFSIINNVRYYKNANEAFAAVNPHMRHIFCPNEAQPKAVINVFDALAEVAKQLTDGSRQKLIELVEMYKNRGQIGEVLLKQKIKREAGEVLDKITASGFKI